MAGRTGLNYLILVLFTVFLAYGWWFGVVTVKSVAAVPERLNHQAFVADFIFCSSSLFTVLALLTGLMLTRTGFSRGLKRFVFISAAIPTLLYFVFIGYVVIMIRRTLSAG
ncbi:MAG: hypothetical protein AB1896_03420 [Thermodesulfobacteriota bacterium]